MALIATHTVTVTGAAPTFAAAANGDTTDVGPGLVLIVKNASGAPITVTIAAAGDLETGDAFPDKVYTVAAAGERWIPMNLARYKDATDGKAHLSYSATTSVTRAVVRA